MDPGDGITREVVQAQLQRIVACREFDASERNRRFLQYVVEETLTGRTDRIKAYSIATSVFGRDESFDPQTDPIIRIEASRLRRSLERYYLTAGKLDPVRIEIPKGSYVPTFRSGATDKRAADASVPERTDVASAISGSPAAINTKGNGWDRATWRRRIATAAGSLAALLLAWLGIAWSGQYPPFSPQRQPASVVDRGPAIFVAPFDNDGGNAMDASLVRGFTREVIIGLTRFDDLSVFGPATSFRYGESADLQASASSLPVDFVVSGGVMVSEDRYRVGVTLVDAKTGRNLWSDVIEQQLTVGGIFQAREFIANRIVQTLAQPYGIIFREKSRATEGTLPHFFTSYQCMLEFYNYWRTLSRSLHANVQKCLEKVVAEDPGYSEAYSALAMVYANIYRYGFSDEGGAFDPLPKALDLARHSLELAPDSVQGYKALHLVYWLMNDVDRSFQAAEQGLALNPNDSEIMADLGGRRCLAGDWERGLPLVQEAFARNPGQPGLYRIVTSLRFYLNGQYEEALAEIEKADIPSVIHYHVILAMAHAQLGQMKEAEADVKEVLRIDPAYGDNVVADLKKHNVYPDLIQAVVEGLRKAGLDVRRDFVDRAS
jgi:TolB-like protein/Tfp pilus assembly protein PilF